MSEVRRSEIMASWFASRYARDEISLEEMETGIERALRGDVTDDEWLRASHEEHMRRVFTEPIVGLDQWVKASYLGPVAPL